MVDYLTPLSAMIVATMTIACPFLFSLSFLWLSLSLCHPLQEQQTAPKFQTQKETLKKCRADRSKDNFDWSMLRHPHLLELKDRVNYLVSQNKNQGRDEVEKTHHPREQETTKQSPSYK